MSRLAVIVAVYPDRRTADIVMTDSWQPVSNVPILSSQVGSDHGSWDFPEVPKPSNSSQVASPSQTGRQIVALVDSAAGRPVIVGFLGPSGGQMAFTQQNRQVYRHASGAYTTIAPDGSLETWHPSGSYVRIGTGGHESLSAHSVDNAWKETSGAAQPTITVHTEKFNVTIDPDGNLTMDTRGNVTVTADGDISMTNQGTFSASSVGAMTLSSEASINATAPHVDWQIGGDLGITATGAATITAATIALNP
jgi:hypothetical protein